MSIKLRISQILWIAAAFAVVLCVGSYRPVAAQGTSGQQPDAQNEDGSRQITLTDFTKERPPAKNSSQPAKLGDSSAWDNKGAKSTKRIQSNIQPRRLYVRHTARRGTLMRVDRPRPVNTSAPATAHPVTAAAEASATCAPPNCAEVGVTIWRLRRARTSDNGPKVSVLGDGGFAELWTPERIEGTAPVSLGDRLRLTIESPRTGYLYVINRTQYDDGTTGQPMLIFPTTRTRGGDNKVTAGRLVDIPDQDDATNFFTLKQEKSGPVKPVGEVLEVIVAPQPITELASVGRNARALAPEEVAKWENSWGGLVESLEMVGGAGQAWTKEEKEASAANGRSLTQEEPTPQTVYRVATKPGDPVMVTVQLLYGTPKTAMKKQ